MDRSQLTWIAKFVWNIADDVLSDLYVRGKYRDVILPMVVLRRLDALLEPSKPAVLDMNTTLDDADITNQDQALRQAASDDFYDTSKYTLRDLKGRASQQQLPQISRIISMASRPPFRKSSNALSSEIRFPACRRPMPSAR